MRRNETPLNSLILPRCEIKCQTIAVEVASLAAEVVPLVVGHTVVWVAVDIDTAAHFPGKYRALAEVVDIPAGTVAGIAGVAVDLPGSWYQTALS